MVYAAKQTSYAANLKQGNVLVMLVTDGVSMIMLIDKYGNAVLVMLVPYITLTSSLAICYEL